MSAPGAVGRRVRSVVGRSLAAANARQALVTVVVAILIAGSAVAAGFAYDRWHAAAQEEMRWSAAASEALRQVYVSEAPPALTIAMSLARTDSLEESARAAGTSGDLAVVYGQAGRFWVKDLLGRTELRNSLVTERYFRQGAGFDVVARLIDYQAAANDVLVSGTAQLLAAGDRWWTAAELLAFAVILVVLLYLLVELLDASRQRRMFLRRGLRLPPGTDDVGLVPRPWSQRRPRRSTVIVAFIAWLLVGILPWMQLRADSVAERTETLSSIELARAAAGTGGAVNVMAFGAIAEATVLLAELAANGAEYTLAPAIAGTPTEVQANALVVLRADQAALPGMRAIAESMSRIPTEHDGVEPTLAGLAASGPMQWKQSAITHGALQDESASATERANLLAAALLMATLVLVLTEIALASSGVRSALIRGGSLLVLVLGGALTGLSILG